MTPKFGVVLGSLHSLHLICLHWDARACKDFVYSINNIEVMKGLILDSFSFRTSASVTEVGHEIAEIRG